jgi:hypothetical protein
MPAEAGQSMVAEAFEAAFSPDRGGAYRQAE